jgi:hypothetical protein
MNAAIPLRHGQRFRAYLAGAIEHAPDGGVGWRRRIEPELDRLGHSYYDATLAECDLLDAEERRGLAHWKHSDLDRFRRSMRKIIDHDLGELVGHADYVVAHWDEWTQSGGGTQGEITLAYHTRIPVYLVTPLSADQVSGWILGCCEAVFSDFPTLVELLEKAYPPSRP